MESLLRDIERERSKMLSDIDNLNRHYDKQQGYIQEYIKQSTIEWAKLVLSHPHAMLLIVETTMLIPVIDYGHTLYEAIRLTTLSLESGEIWDQLMHPTHTKEVTGTQYHGLSMADLENKPKFREVLADIQQHIEGHQIIIFGAEWANKTVQPTAPNSLFDGAYCLHNKCKEYYGEFYHLDLEKVLGYQGIDAKREQITDSRDRILLLRQVIQNLAAGMEKQPIEEEPLEEIEDHPF